MSIIKLVHIDDNSLNQVKKYVGFPTIDKILLDDDQIKEFAVQPALYEYFQKFPLERREQLQVLQDFSFDFPDDVFGVVDARIVGKTQRGQGNSDFWQLVRFNSQFFRSPNLRYIKPRYNYGGLQYQYIDQHAVLNSLQNLETFKIYTNYPERKIEGYSNISTSLFIIWAVESYRFDDVKPTQKFNVIKLAAAYLMEYLVNIGSIMSDNEVTRYLNIDALKSRMEELRSEVLDVWKEIPDIILFRAS